MISRSEEGVSPSRTPLTKCRALSRLRAVLRVDPSTGDRTIVADASTGSGPAFGFPQGIAVEAEGTLVVVDPSLLAVLRVDLITGDRVVLSTRAAALARKL